MYKNKDKQREVTRERVRRYREKGVTEGVTVVGQKGVTSQGITYPDIIDKLTDPFWRDKLEKVCLSFKARNPQDMAVCWLGNMNLATVCDWLECTA